MDIQALLRGPRGGRRVPLAVTLPYTLFVAIVLPIYWKQYTPLNFLWFCDVALLTTLVGLWLESALLLSMQLIAILLPQFLWQVDFVAHLGTGFNALGLSAYMFDPSIPLFIRGLSLFHFWLPILLLWLVWRLGYDHRALKYQAFYGCGVLLLAFLLTSDIAGPAGNVDKVLGPSDIAPETFMPHVLWLLLLMAVAVVCINAPAHFLMRWVYRKRPAAAA